MQYQSECLSALKSVVNIHKPFEKTFMDAMKLFMAIPDRINFLQLGRYGRFSEQTYRNLFEHETFDWFAFNGSIISKHLTGKRKAIAIDPSYIPKSGKKTPWIGYFWSGCAGEYKRGLEIMGIGVIDIDNHECMTLGSIQTPDCKTLDNMDKNLVDWYSSYLISRKDKIQSISRTVVADAFFSKETFITPMCENDFHVISRFRDDVILYYPTLEQKTGKRGHPKWFDGRIDFANLDLTRCKEYEVNKGKLYGLRVYAKALKRYVSLAIWYPMDGRTDKGSFTSLQTIRWMGGRFWIITEPGSNWNFALEMVSNMQESPTVSQPTSESWIFTSMHRLLLSTWPKRHVRGSE